MKEILRTFVAVETPSFVREAAVRLIRELRGERDTASVKWVEPGDMHWTLKFLGEIDILEAPAICQAVSLAVRGLDPFDVEALGAGAFPVTESPRTLWLGVGQGAEQMVLLHNAVEDGLADLGFRREGRRFRPHLTIGRVRRTDDADLGELTEQLRVNKDFEGGVSLVDEVVVYSSRLSRNGPTYEPLGHCELRGR